MRTSAYNLGDRMNIDGCRDVPCIVTGILFKGDGISYELQYFHNGDLKTAYWIDEFRLTKQE